jgi:hypothetical protein
MKKPQIATLDKVIITRNGDYAEITNRDQTVTAMSLKIGPEVAQMTDREILDHFNATVMAMQRSAASYRHRAEEIPPGMPQVSYFEQSDQWVPRGHVLRCVIHDEGRRPIIEIDDRDFTLEEFGAMLTTFSGWGMRIVFVPDSDLEKPPVIVVREPKD